ncbi:MAG: hypothetical protein DRP49_00665 [Spirochaetes bacterium]|nr:MAG: hypothetical protein DRP49_00665 [Spirochaetota bacterium]
MDVVLGIDLGTSYFKAAVVNRSGALLGLGRSAVPVGDTSGGTWEVEIDRFWHSIKTIIDEACARGGVKPFDICGVSYASQANSFLMLDADYKPLTPIILWPDNRGLKNDNELNGLWVDKEYPDITGMSFKGSEFAIAKVRWFQKKMPELWSGVRHFMTISDYLAFKLTDKPIGDSGTASLLGIYNLRDSRWWGKALSALNIPESYLSQTSRPGTVAGITASFASEYLGLISGTPFSLGGLDHHIAALGAGAGQISGLSESTGTVLAFYQSPISFKPDQLSCLGPSITDGEYYRLSFNDNGGRGVEWYRSNFAEEYSLPELDNMAAGISPGSDGLIALPEVFRERDLSRFVNVKASHTHGHYFRAIMESTAVSLSSLINRACPDDENLRILATGGGAGSRIWLRVKAMVTGSDLITSSSSEPAAYGAAMLASVAAGWFESSKDAAQSWVNIKEIFTPGKNSRKELEKWLVEYQKAVKKYE